MLDNLLPEIFSQVVYHIQDAGTLSNLSLTCRAIHKLVEAEGWKTFVLYRFPSFQAPPIWRDAAHGLTTLSRNLDRRAFIACEFEPFNTPIHTVPQGRTEVQRGKWRHPKGQTMGYQPVIDSYEIISSDDWGSRKEVVAWGAGARLMMKNTYLGKAVGSRDDWQPENVGSGNKIEWVQYHNPLEHLEGRDDITTLKIVLPYQRSAEGLNTVEEMVVGRASGELSLIHLGNGTSQTRIRYFDTAGSPVRSADINGSHAPLLAACLGDSRAVLYSVHGSEPNAVPISEVSCVAKTEKRCRTWSSRFLSARRLAVGRGASNQIVHVYEVRPTGLSEKPIRCFGSGKDFEKSQTSAYSIAAMPDSSISSDVTGNMFFSGGYDGVIRLHDMRSPSDIESCISDPTEDSAIFSLLTIGRERVVAGSALHGVVKIFDIRMPGGRVYNYLDAQAHSQVNLTAQTSAKTNAIDGASQEPAWNLFVHHQQRKGKEAGPIYSLSRPSPSSTSLYVGREDSITHLNFTSIMDKHPDPVFNTRLRRTAAGIDIQNTWDPAGSNRALNLSMYEQVTSAWDWTPLKLKDQRNVGRTLDARIFIPGYDERWVKAGN